MKTIHVVALLGIATFGLTVAIPMAATGMSVEEAASLCRELLLQWLTP